MHVVRDSQPLFLFLSSRILSLKKFFRQILIFLGEKTHVAKKKRPSFEKYGRTDFTTKKHDVISAIRLYFVEFN